MRGKLIVFDGGDGAGKETQAKLLKEALIERGMPVLTLSFPRYEDTLCGRILKRALAGEFGDFLHLPSHIASLLYAGDRAESRYLIEKALASGTTVVLDRYVSANQIHQGGKIEDETRRLEFLARLDDLEYGYSNLPRPDISIYLDVPPAISEELMKDRVRDTVEKDKKYLEDSYRSAHWLINRNPERWLWIECVEGGKLRSRENIHKEIVSRLSAKKALF